MASALGSAVVAQSKNRGGCLWFVIGLAGGPLGLLAAILTPKAPDPPLAGADPPSGEPNAPP
jgi:hypothetical protein